MEKWQSDHLTVNKTRLVEGTVCNELLLSHLQAGEVLSKEDLEVIKDKNGDENFQVEMLYDIMKTKPNGFTAMAKALAQVNQTGPCSIFMNGFFQHAIPDMRINLLGNTFPLLTELFDVKTERKMIQDILAHVTPDQFASMLNGTNNAIQLVNDTIPDQVPVYIPRMLQRRVIVDKGVFKIDSPDLFVFKGITPSKLRRLVEPQRIAHSTSEMQCLLSTRFIYLERDEDMMEIWTMAGVPVHLVRYEESTENCILETTSGGSRVLQHFWKNVPSSWRNYEIDSEDEAEWDNASTTIPEEDFIEEVLESHSGVCISGPLASGKSVTLTNLARTVKERCPGRIVAFVQLATFLEHAAKNGCLAALDDGNASPARAFLLEYLTPSSLACCILTELLKKGILQLELFLDRYDDVKEEHQDTARQMLTALASDLPNTRFHAAATNVQGQYQLEQTFGLKSFELVPFTHDNQVDYLTLYWSRLNFAGSPAKLREYANFCLKKLGEAMGEKERQIAGAPLQCLLIAEAFSRLAEAFTNPKRNVAGAQDKVEGTLSGLYKSFIENRLKKAVSHLAPQDTTELMSEVKDFHVMHALNVLLPEATEFFSHAFDSARMTHISSTAMSAGILQQRPVGNSTTVQFKHRSFAEYLVAEYFFNLVFSEEPPCHIQLAHALIPLIFAEVMKTRGPEGNFIDYVFYHPNTAYFFNSMCAENKVHAEYTCLPEMFPDCIPEDKLRDLVHTAIRKDCNGIFLFVKKVLLRMNSTHLQVYKASFFPPKEEDDDGDRVTNLLNDAAKYSSVAITRHIFQLFHDCFQMDLDDICKTITSRFSNPLSTAVAKADYEMVQFFVDKIPMEGKELLQDCFERSEGDTAEMVEKRQKVCKLLFDKKVNIFQQEKDVLMMAYSVHVDHIKFLLQNGTSPREVQFKGTMISSAAMSMAGKEFHELCGFLIEDCGAVDLFEEQEGKWESPLPRMLSCGNINEHTILMIYDFPGLSRDGSGEPKMFALKDSSTFTRIPVDINLIFYDEQTLLMLAAKGRRSVKMLKCLIDMGANIMAEDHHKSTFAHYIAECYSAAEYHEIVQLVVNQQMGAVFQKADRWGGTPLLQAAGRLELFPETLDILTDRCGVDVNAISEHGSSILGAAVSGKTSLAFVKRLVELGADWKMGKSKVIHVSASCGLVGHLKYFVELGCDINELDEDGNNALQLAVRDTPETLLDIVEFLVANGVQKGNKNKYGDTAYSWATSGYGYKRIGEARILKLLR